MKVKKIGGGGVRVSNALGSANVNEMKVRLCNKISNINLVS